MVPIQPSSEITTGPGIIYSFIHSSQGACLWADHHALHLFAIHIHLAKSLLRNINPSHYQIAHLLLAR